MNQFVFTYMYSSRVGVFSEMVKTFLHSSLLFDNNNYYINNNNTGFKNIDDKIALGAVTAYVCCGFTCEKPINDFNEFSNRIDLL